MVVRFLLAVALLGAIAGAVIFVPIHGRTVLDRWHAAPGPAQFATRGLAEAKAALGLAPPPSRTPPRPADRARAQRPSRSARPTENHSDEDRAALDRLLADRDRR